MTQIDAPAAPALDSFSAMLRTYTESRRTAADHDAPRVTDAPPLYSPIAAPDAPRHALPAPLAHTGSAYQALIERTAIRFFDDPPVPQAHLAILLKAASDGDRHDWPEDVANGIDLSLMVVAWRVADVAPAVYLYDAAAHALAFVGDAPNPTDGGVNLVLQVEFALSPVIILMTGNLAAASAQHGSWGHRQLLLRAGTAGQRLWLTAQSIGLVGTTFAGFLPRAAQRIAHIDGYRNASLLAFATGFIHPTYPVPDPTDPNL